MEDADLQSRVGSVGNQYALTLTMSWLLSLPFVLWQEGDQVGGLLEALSAQPLVLYHIVGAGLCFYVSNELATVVVQKTDAVSQSVANTAKRVIVMLGTAVVLGELLSPLKVAGCLIGVVGVFVYSVIDSFLERRRARLG